MHVAITGSSGLVGAVLIAASGTGGHRVTRMLRCLVLGFELAGAALFDSHRAFPTRLLDDGFRLDCGGLSAAFLEALDSPRT